jgi:hypothetical protein
MHAETEKIWRFKTFLKNQDNFKSDVKKKWSTLSRWKFYKRGNPLEILMVRWSSTIQHTMGSEAFNQLWILARQYISNNSDWLHFFCWSQCWYSTKFLSNLIRMNLKCEHDFMIGKNISPFARAVTERLDFFLCSLTSGRVGIFLFIYFKF